MERTYKVPMSTYFGLGLFAAGLAFLCLLVPCIFAYPPVSATKLFWLSVIAVVVPAGTIWWLSRFRITITPSRLTYSSPGCGGQSVELSDIESAGVVMQRSIRGSRPLLEVRSPTKVLRIHFRVFSHKARKDLFQVVGA